MDDTALSDIFSADFGLDSSDEEKTIQESQEQKRTFQSEDDFLRQRKNWTPKLETREVRLAAMVLMAGVVASCCQDTATADQIRCFDTKGCDGVVVL